MMKPTENNQTEQHIIAVARQVFIEKGFVETSMSDIAARAGINRPGLHYYYRTKDRMFEAVFSDILNSFIPKVHQIVLQDLPVSERMAQIVDVYLNMVQKNPSLPAFGVKEIQRDAAHWLDTLIKTEAGNYILQIKEELHREMACGKIKQVPLEFVLYTFYGLLFVPFLFKPLTDVLQITSDDSEFASSLQRWKASVVEHMCMLLCVPETEGGKLQVEG